MRSPTCRHEQRVGASLSIGTPQSARHVRDSPSTAGTVRSRACAQRHAIPGHVPDACGCVTGAGAVRVGGACGAGWQHLHGARLGDRAGHDVGHDGPRGESRENDLRQLPHSRHRVEVRLTQSPHGQNLLCRGMARGVTEAGGDGVGTVPGSAPHRACAIAAMGLCVSTRVRRRAHTHAPGGKKDIGRARWRAQWAACGAVR